MTRTLRRLELDFRRRPAGATWTGWVLLVLALVFTGDLAQTYLESRATLATAEARLAKLTRSADRNRPASRASSATPEEIAAARETYHRLAMPWNELFGALESAGTDRVTLVAIEPDAKSGTVMISGEARDYPAVLDYVVKLRQSAALSSAYLVKHEARQGGTQAAVGFAVAANWGEVKR
jgi:hypothetical protein